MVEAEKNIGVISTHAPRTGSDTPVISPANVFVYFNPRSPHGERRLCYERPAITDWISTHAPRTGSDIANFLQPFQVFRFQPTLPARGATFALPVHLARRSFQPTLPARGATIACLTDTLARIEFQPTLPARGATRPKCAASASTEYFNPRSPHGERRNPYTPLIWQKYFNPRSPHGERHSPHVVRCSPPRISTHAPRTGSDVYQFPYFRFGDYFNPRSPHGERRGTRFKPTSTVPISTHAPRTGSDLFASA